MNDGIIEFKRPSDPNTQPGNATDEPNALPNIGSLEVTAEGLGFADLEAAMNMRAWLERTCEAAGAKRVGGGIGCGQADIDIELEGCRFNVSIRPI